MVVKRLLDPSGRDLSRRTFLQTAATAASAWVALPQSLLYGGVPDASRSPEAAGAVPIAFREPVDLLICGSTLFACQLALDATRAGWRTLLVLDRANPFFEGVSCLRSWIPVEQRAVATPLLGGVLSDPATREIRGDRIYFNAMRAVLDIENQFCAAGVRFVYNAEVAGALGHEGRLGGVVFGGKTGLFAVEARAVVDATCEATVARAAGASFTPVSGPRQFRYVADLRSAVEPRRVSYRASGAIAVSVDIDYYYADFHVTLPAGANGPLAYAEEYERLYAASLACPWRANEQRFRGADAFLASARDRLDPASLRVPGLSNLFVFGPHGLPDNAAGSLALARGDTLFQAFPAPLERVRAACTPLPTPRPLYDFWNRGVPAAAAPNDGLQHRFLDHGFSEPGATPAPVRFTPPADADRTQVLVVGGGTSGNAAAYACAARGLATLCVDRALELGGTNTLGGVSKLWYGNKTRAFAEYYQQMGAKNDGLNAPGFYRGTRAAGCRLRLHTAVTGVACADGLLRRVYVLTPFGLTAIAADQIVDATGDGAIAAWAGCGYVFGGEHDELTLWASFAGFRPGNPEAMRPFLSPLDERSPVDVTRFIVAMRRNSSRQLVAAKHFPPPFYVAPRESRHIRCGRTVTYLDVVAGRRCKDGILRIESNPDIKGVATSDAAKAGFIPRHWERLFQVTVPYQALIPTGIDNVIVVGKAYSASHDALSAARMQRDLCVLGLVAGEALALALPRQIRLRDVPVAELQAVLIAKGMLKPEDLAADDLGFGAAGEELAQQVIQARDLDACLEASARLCLLPRAAVWRWLEPHAGPEHQAVNRVLAFLGHPTATAHLAAAVARALDEPVLSRELFGGDGNRLSMPDQGYAPWTALRLHALAQAGDRRAVPLLARLAERVSCQVEDLRSSWGYFYSLACGFERLACVEGQAPLAQLLRQPLFAGRLVPREGDWRAGADTVAERLGYLRLALARALTRCGSAEGALLLCDFLDEARLCYARAARSELVAAAGKDFGFEAVTWRRWIEQNRSRFAPHPLRATFA